MSFIFGSAVPNEIWPVADQCFAASDHKRANRAKSFVVRELTLLTIVSIGLGVLLLAGCASVAVAQFEALFPVIVIGIIILLLIIFGLKGCKGEEEAAQMRCWLFSYGGGLVVVG